MMRVCVWVLFFVWCVCLCAACGGPVSFSDAGCDAAVADAGTRMTVSLLPSEESLVFTEPRVVDAGDSSPSSDAPVLFPDAAVAVDGSAHTSSDATASDGSTSDAGSAPFGLEAQVLSPITCHGRTLRLPPAFHAPGVTAWHFCYVTPDPRTDAGAGVPRPVSVSFQRANDKSFRLEPMIVANAPRMANPWTASVAVAIPDDGAVPRFNVRLELPPVFGSMLWALDREVRGGLESRGTLRAWRVAPNGTQTEVPLRPLFAICQGLMGSTGFAAGHYVPEGLCPRDLAACPPGPFHCQR